MVLSLDVAPSVVDLCGAKPLRDAQEKSCKPLLQGRRTPLCRAFLYENNYETQFPYTPNVRAMRTPNGNSSAIRTQTDPRIGLPPKCTISRIDPSEMKNLANDPKWARQRRALEGELEKQSKAADPDSMPVFGGIVNVLPTF